MCGLQGWEGMARYIQLLPWTRLLSICEFALPMMATGARATKKARNEAWIKATGGLRTRSGVRHGNTVQELYQLARGWLEMGQMSMLMSAV